MPQVHGITKTKRSGCSRTQLLLIALLFPATLFFVYFIHHTHLVATSLPLLDSNIDTTTILTKGISQNNEFDKVEQLQKFKGGKSKQPIHRTFDRNQKFNKTSNRIPKSDDDIPIEGKPPAMKKISPLLNNKEYDTEIVYGDKGVDDDDSDDDSADDNDDSSANSKTTAPNVVEVDRPVNRPSPGPLEIKVDVDPVYGEIEEQSGTHNTVIKVDRNHAYNDVNIKENLSVYYTASDDDEEQPELKKSLEGTNDLDSSMEISQTPSPSKRVYLPGYKDKEKLKKMRAHATNKLFNFQPEWGSNGEFKHIQVLPTLKIPLKKDRRVVFPNLTMLRPSRNILDLPTGLLGESRELRKANEILRSHPLHSKPEWYDGQHSLEEVMVYIQNSPYCYQQKPVFLSMATVHDDLYWQLIENFVYTMVKFNTSQCSLVICVSDPNCMKMCGSSFFPCYNYMEEHKPLPSVMEQIAKVKLFYVPKALTMGVDVFMLDLDVGFLGDPNLMIQAFYATPIVDIMVQEDYIFIMNRTKAGWKQWFTEPLPNIGLFLCRGNNKTAKVFDIAWQKYLLMDDPWEKAQPGKDQNHVLDAMRIGRGEFGLKYAYFSNSTAPLLDKLVLNYGNVMELGGELMESFLLDHQSVAMHTTCYEKSTKVMGLKAANSFWNPKYYDALRKTITKQILFKNEGQLLDEVRSMVWLAIVTERSFILPNILGPESIHTIGKYKGQSMWPGFRVTFLKRSKGKNELKVQILEPNFYWRVNRDYDAIPSPTIIYFDPDKETLLDIKEKVETAFDAPRIILQHISTARGQQHHRKENQQLQIATAIEVWANDSVGLFHEPFSQLVKSYRAIPSVKGVRSNRAPLVDEVLQGMRNCANIFGPHKGNRTCFQVCD